MVEGNGQKTQQERVHGGGMFKWKWREWFWHSGWTAVLSVKISS